MKNRGMNKKVFACAALVLMLLSCSSNIGQLTNPVVDKRSHTKDLFGTASEFIRYDDQNIKYNGRINFDDGDYAILYWSGSSIKIKFVGTEIKALLKNEKNENYYNVIIDDSIYILEPSTIKQWYTLASGLDNEEHTVELFRRGEWASCGKTYFYGFEVPGNTEILPPEPADMIIEFYGNSIISGRSIEDPVGDSPEGTYTNNYLSYSAITARYFNADYYCISRSGIGITISWFDMVMDDMYYRLDPNDPNSFWDFSKVRPNIVVINLFQNDSWLVDMPEYYKYSTFGNEKPSDEFLINAYKDFLQKIRDVYPTAPIICSLGSMDATESGSPWPGYISSAVELMDDFNIYTCFFPYQGKEGHPKVKEHEEMANILIKFIEDNIKITCIRDYP